MQRATVIGDPYYELNWLHNNSWWTENDWVYTKTFTASAASLGKQTTSILVLDGVKMNAEVSINGKREYFHVKYVQFKVPTIHVLLQRATDTLSV